MQTNEFYRGLLNELRALDKSAGTTLAPVIANKPAPIPKPAPNPAPAPTPNPGIGSSIMHGAANTILPGSSMLWDNRWSMAGRGANAIENNVPYAGDWLKNTVNSKIDNHVANASGFPQDGQALPGYAHDFMRNNANALSHLNDPNSGPLASRSLGAATYNPKTNSVDTDYSKIPGYLANKAEGWMGQHPWLTGIGAGTGILGMLAMLLKSSPGNQVAPQSQQQVSTQVQPTHPSFF